MGATSATFLRFPHKWEVSQIYTCTKYLSYDWTTLQVLTFAMWSLWDCASFCCNSIFSLCTKQQWIKSQVEYWCVYFVSRLSSKCEGIYVAQDSVLGSRIGWRLAAYNQYVQNLTNSSTYAYVSNSCLVQLYYNPLSANAVYRISAIKHCTRLVAALE